MSLTQGLRPFAPRNAGDLQVSDVIKFSRQGGKLSQGTIKFIGHLPGRGDIYLGVELDKEGNLSFRKNRAQLFKTNNKLMPLVTKMFNLQVYSTQKHCHF